ncbi:hypothetical protein BKP45_01160 [Anaerobacillus alkalidiazotrophicus]|uniref:Spo0E family sporulation regulatory protein-aspartic acid phosphatase n=1 Tax=Anaerobacillus alkalidiazotrophicus TaxID=472963 RepID=A0A1S2M9X0_9BACI|nr:aspartyl-phosphate phosphatase Spo0E family protein [Anaerobacillus alkalidiazotrophicus]OIJ21414.1 hypothetical protein BKP45_01160 [Anaerobacillus alkalidiazotrophicus]
MTSKNILRLYIEHKRTMMINAAYDYGFNAEITIQHSQELDELLNKYSRIIIEKQENDLPSYQF